jgi:hypothetical protein
MHVREWGGREERPLVFWHALGAGTSGAYLTERRRCPELARLVRDWATRLPA